MNEYQFPALSSGLLKTHLSKDDLVDGVRDGDVDERRPIAADELPPVDPVKKRLDRCFLHTFIRFLLHRLT